MDQDIENYLKEWENWHKNLNDKDKAAKDAGTLVGRYIQEGRGDGYAYYEIVKAGPRKVTIKHLDDGGDNWVIPYWGLKASIDRSFAEQSVRRRDAYDKLFPRHESLHVPPSEI